MRREADAVAVYSLGPQDAEATLGSLGRGAPDGLPSRLHGHDQLWINLVVAGFLNFGNAEEERGRPVMTVRHSLRAAPARVGPPVRAARGPRRAAGRRSVRGVRVECRNRILFRREVRPSPRGPFPHREESRLLTARSPLLFSQEVDERDDGAESVTLALGDSRSEHVRGVLKLTAGDSLRVGVVNGSPATAVVSTMDATSTRSPGARR